MAVNTFFLFTFVKRLYPTCLTHFNHPKMKFKLSVLSFLVLTVSLFAGNPLDNFIHNPLLQNANVSLLVKELGTNKVVCQFRPNNVTIPASCMKLVTTATALELLGPSFCFQTKLEIDGTLNSNGVLNGNLYIRGGGDPTLGSEKMGDFDFLTKWVEAVKEAGIKKINGQIVADGTLFDEEGVNPKWTWEDIGNYYAAGAYGISYMDNTLKLYVRSGAVGTTPEILRTIPEISSLEFENHLTSTNIDSDSAYFYGAPKSGHRIIRGEIPANRLEFYIKGDIPNPSLLLAEHFQKKLMEGGIFSSEFPSDIVKKATQRRVIHVHNSPPLNEIIEETNVHSNNGYAEEIFRYLALKSSSVATSNGAIREIRSFWKTKELPVNQLYMYDGCGLSPLDAVSANFFVELLTYMKKESPNKEAFFNSLPVSGKSGTLANFLVKTSLQGKVHAKSGTIAGVKCYAGYIEKNNKTYVFSILVNHFDGTSKAVTRKMEEFLLQLTAGRKR
jgi:serine-type D-Ala-D-Ala carboxypeptidase/endopeptidase (penicillin-binding protein 4)